MKVFTVFLNGNQGFLIVVAKDKEQVLKELHTNKNSPIVEQETDMSGVYVDIYEEEFLNTTCAEPTFLSYNINL